MIIEENALAHYGILRKSGRYPWGSGGTQSQRNKSFLDTVEDLRKKGMSETEIAAAFSSPDHKLTTTELRAAKSIAKAEQKQSQIGMATRLKEKGYSNVAIGKRMGIPESSVRALLAPAAKDKADILQATSQVLKDQVAKKGLLDVGVGVERYMGISAEKLKTAVAALKEEGYTVHYVKVEQLGTGQQTTIKVLAKPGVTYGEVYRNRSQIQAYPDVASDDGGRSYSPIQKPLSINSRRVAIRYAEQGGSEADGMIYVRPGVKDVSLGGARYAQVRIAVDGTHYIKGMAVYKDDLPPGKDIVFNTNKRDTGRLHDALKPLKTDKETGKLLEDNPFGAVVKQIGDPIPGQPGKKKLTSVMNVVNEEGDWSKWSRTLSSQMLSKQSPKLAKEQLAMVHERKKQELDEIMAMTNPTIRKKLLESFADDADSASVHLKAHALPRTANHVILPISSIKENEIYAPGFNNGERVVLIRHPHGGTFEIPELTVNNRNREARALVGTDAPDAVGIHHKTAQRLSGADFDGDTVLVIPNNRGKVKSTPALADLKGFDPVAAYPSYPGMPKMSARTKQQEMGKISNLITDMTIKGAPTVEIARAVKHSMVVIDAEKHNLNYKQSAIDNGIAQLSKKYQDKAAGGAATLISRAGSEVRVPQLKPRSAAKGGPIDKATGKKVFDPNSAESFVDSRTGRVVVKTRRSEKLAETQDAHTLSSGTPIEKVYADHSNGLKTLANQARKEAVGIKGIKYSPSAKKAYAKEVERLNAALNTALRNAPLERNAQVIANAIFSQKKASNPDMEPDIIKREKKLALETARARTGAKKHRIEISDREWEAIQAGAITPNKLSQILNNTDLDLVKKLAAPREKVKMTSSKKNRALGMLKDGYTQAEVAAALGVSLTTLKNSLSE